MMKFILYPILIVLALLCFVYFGGGHVLHALGDRSLLLEKEMKALLKDVDRDAADLRQKAEKLPQKLRGESKELKNTLQDKDPPKR